MDAEHYIHHSLPEASFSVVWPTNLTIKMTGLSKDVIDSVLSQTYTALDQDDETEKFVAYGVLLARATSAMHRTSPVEKSLLLALYDDLYLSRGFFAPVDIQHALNRVFHSQKRMSSKFIVNELTLRHHKNRLHFTFHIVVRLRVDGELHMSHVIMPNNGFYYTSSVDAGSVLSPFVQATQAEDSHPIPSRIHNIQERTLRRLMSCMFRLEGTEGSNLLRRLPGTSLVYSVVFRNIYEDAGKSLTTRGGILMDVANPYRLVPLFLTFKCTDDTRDSIREENSQEDFLGTILFCAAQTKKLWYRHLQQSGLRVYVYRKSNTVSRLRRIPNASDVVVIISHAQAYKEYRGMFIQTPFRQTYAIQTPFNVCFTCAPETPVSLFYVGCRRMIVTDTGQLSTYKAMGIIRKQAARIRWVLSDEIQYPSCTDYRLYCNRLVCNNAFYECMLHSNRLSNTAGIVPAQTTASTYMTSFSLTPAGHELLRQRIHLYLVENEIGDEGALVQTDHMSDEAVNDLDVCCVCYDGIKEVDGRSFTWLSCQHYLCTTCFTTIRGTRNHVSCPLCRQSSRFPDQIHERTAGVEIAGEEQSLPLTTKIEYIQTQLQFSSVPIGCVANRRMQRFLKNHFRPEELNRIIFLSEAQANLRLSVEFKLCIFMPTYVSRQHIVPICRCLYRGYRVETVAFTRDRIHDGQEDSYST